MSSFTRRTDIPAPADDVFAWHERPGAMERLTPPWQTVEVLQQEGMEDGDRAVIRIGTRLLSATWELEHRRNRPGTEFTDVQVKGPFAHWEHTHSVQPHDIDSRMSVLEDHVDYGLPASRLSQPIAGRTAERELVRLFAYRHRVTREDIIRHQEAGLRPQTIAVTGSTGLIGSALVPFLTTAGHTVVRLVRSRRQQVDLARSPQERTAYWQPGRGYVEAGALEGVDAVIHLAGEPVFWRRWTRRQRARILDSRARGTRLLAETLAAMPHPPRVLLSASGYMVYGDRGHEVLGEAAGAGEGFLPDVCRAWERATGPASSAGVRVCHMRFGLVLSPAGGALGALLPAVRLGVGGTIGRGAQWMPWIAIDDALYALLHLMAQDELHGPHNICAPHPVSQRKFASAVAGGLRRPAVLRVPPVMVGVVAGAEAQRAIAASTRAVPERLANSGFRFAYPRLTDALEHVLGRDVAVPTEP